MALAELPEILTSLISNCCINIYGCYDLKEARYNLLFSLPHPCINLGPADHRKEKEGTLFDLCIEEIDGLLFFPQMGNEDIAVYEQGPVNQPFILSRRTPQPFLISSTYSTLLLISFLLAHIPKLFLRSVCLETVETRKKLLKKSFGIWANRKDIKSSVEYVDDIRKGWGVR